MAEEHKEGGSVVQGGTNDTGDSGKDGESSHGDVDPGSKWWGRNKEQRKKEAPVQAVPFYKLFTYADTSDVLLMVLGTAGSVAAGLAMPLLALLIGQLTDAFGKNVDDMNKLQDEVTKVSLRFLYLACAVAVASYLQVGFWILTGERQSQRIRTRYLQGILRQNIGYFDMETTTGEVIGRMSGDTVLIQEAMGEKVGHCLQHLSTFFGGFVVAFTRGWLLTLVLLAALPCMAGAGFLVATVIQRLASTSQKAYTSAGTVVEETVGGIRTVFAFVGEKKAAEAYDERLEKAYRNNRLEGVFSGLGVGTMLLCMFSTYALALWYGSRLIAKGDYSGGEVLSVLISVLIGGMSLGQASPDFSSFSSGSAAAFKMFETIQRKPEIDSDSLSGEKIDKVRGEVELAHVDFAYPARLDVQIFRDFSLVIPAGKTAALVGESGSGKSTVVSLIQRFYDPQSGTVMVDGIDIRKLQLKWFRQQLGLVSQEPVLFAQSIRENILYGKDDATAADIEEACKMANIHRFISSLPMGYETQVGERGTQLSGGQKQRLAIARAVLRNPRILLLDEATSALDAESEHVVQEALDRVMLNRTTIVIAHRLSTVRNADMIAVVQRGQIVEKGTHSALLSNPEGAYSQLIRLQQTQGQEDGTVQAKQGAVPTDLAVKRELAQLSEVDSHSSFAAGSTGGASGGGVEAVQKEGLRKRGWFKKGKKIEEAEEKKEEQVDEAVEAGKKTRFSRLLKLNAPESPFFIVGALGAAVNGLSFPIFSVLLSSIIKVFYYTDMRKMRREADKWAGLFVLLGAGSMCGVLLQNATFAFTGARLVRRVRRLSFAAVLRQELSWFEDPQNTAGAVGARLSTDAAQVKGMVGERLGLVAQNVATIVAGFVIAFSSNWKLTLVVLSIVPLLGISGYMQVAAMQGLSGDAKKMYEDASGVANDAVSSIRTVAAFGAEDKVLQLYKEKCRTPMKAGIRTGNIAGLGMGFSFFVMFSAYALSFWYGGKLVKAGETTFDKVFKVFFAIVMMAMGVSQSAAIAPDFAKVQNAVESIFKTLDRKPKIDSDNPEGTQLTEVKGVVDLKDVVFSYPLRPDIMIFRGITLNIPAGQTTALVGESGSGKSTVIALVERFYDPHGGQVLLDGVDIRKLNLKWLRSQVGLVSQEPVLFNQTIRDNIRYGKVDASEAEIESAARMANAHNFISGLPNGYATLVGERGIQLSGGQKQRVAIARAIVKDPRILLLDEATSALDAESEHVVQEALDRAMVNRTTVVIAHRLSTIRNAHSIAVVQRGKIVEQGPHVELLRNSIGVYSSLVQLQSASSTS